jgi:hypothetical protein
MPRTEIMDSDTGKVAIIEDDGTIHDAEGKIIPGVANVKEAIEWTKKVEKTQSS